ncbi:hypothetical protein MMC10_003305, partial [Thelotrema lepadinum]|nr:hypothetical protein [Thelotrema lepadinum]
TSLLTFKWVKDYRKPWPDFRTYHVCRNFEDIRTFAADRWFEPFALGILSHPQLGALNWSDHSSTPLPTRPIQYLDIE